MYTVSPVHSINREAAEALAAYRLVIFNASDDSKVEYPAAEFDACIGITAHAAASGERIDVIMLGPARLKVDGNVANILAGDLIVNHTDAGYGRKVAATANTVYRPIGIALGAATADGADITVFVMPGLTHSTAT
jgi:acyl CoA:acetate/3-ketoacid CoA transferase beta subunit